MTFDPLKFYDDEQRKQKRYDSLLPVFLVAVVLLVAFYGFFVAYQRSHAKPRPAAVTTKESDWLPSPGNMGTQWIRCNEGMEVTDYRDCPEFKTAYARAYTVLARKLYPQQTHKRKTDIYSLCRTNHGTVSQCRAEADYLAGKTSGTLTANGAVFRVGSVPASPRWDTYEGGFTPYFESKSKYVFEGCDPVSSMSIGRYSDIIVTCSGREVQLIWRDGPHETTPADITRLMEQIAPTKTRCEYPFAGEGCAPVAEWNNRCVSWSVERGYFPGDCAPKSAPACKMPADIDVCPVQMIDKKGKP